MANNNIIPFFGSGGLVSDAGGCAALTGSFFEPIDSNDDNDYDFPIHGLYDYSVCAWIINAEELGAAKQFQRMEIFKAAGGSYTFNNQTVYMAHVTENRFDSSPAIDLSDLTISDLTQVITSENLIMSSTDTWYGFDFDNNFCYNGVDNVVIRWENRDGSWSGGFPAFDTDTQTGTGTYSRYAGFQKSTDNSYPTGNATRVDIRANTKLKY